MAIERFGTVSIFRPSLGIASDIREVARAHLYSRFRPGEYRGREAVNGILQHQYGVYQALLTPLIPRLASRDGAEFMLSQYDEAWKLLHGNGILDLREREIWMKIEPCMKRAIKFLVEAICMFGPAPSQAPRSRRQAQAVSETALACAECMVDLAMQSDIVHSIFPDDCVLRVLEEGTYDFTLEIEGEGAGHDEEFSRRLICDRQSRSHFVPSPQFDNHTPTHQRFLDGPFREAFDLSYGEFINIIASVVEGAQPSLHPNAFPTLFVNRDRVIAELSECGQNRNTIERALDGFSIKRENLLKEKRAVWKPKQQNRAYRRGFFVLPHEDGPHLAFSRQMARESLIQLVNWVPYRHLPVEWRTDITTAALSPLSREAGRWFEAVVRHCLTDLGFDGSRVERTIGRGLDSLPIPPQIGELDYIGYRPQEGLLLIAEAKMVLTGLEAAYWRDDLDEFVFRRGSYAERFRRKLEWATENSQRICAALGVPACNPVRGVMLTLYPCIARAFIADFPCVSITEFMLDYEEHGRWPYRSVLRSE